MDHAQSQQGDCVFNIHLTFVLIMHEDKWENRIWLSCYQIKRQLSFSEELPNNKGKWHLLVSFVPKDLFNVQLLLLKQNSIWKFKVLVVLAIWNSLQIHVPEYLILKTQQEFNISFLCVHFSFLCIVQKEMMRFLPVLKTIWIICNPIKLLGWHPMPLSLSGPGATGFLSPRIVLPVTALPQADQCI